MTLKIAVVGAPGSGKTLFCINWARYLGATRIQFCEFTAAGKREGIITPQAARDKMAVNGSSQTARTFIINRPGKIPSRLTLIDTPCLRGKPDLTSSERSKLSLTLQILSEVDVIFNLVDLACSDPLRMEFAAEVDRCLSGFSARRQVLYRLVGNKFDLINGCPEITSWWFSGQAINISAKKWTGFDILTEEIAKSQSSGYAGRVNVLQ
ncbi:MAG TPA: hypothetical protein GX693_00290 [Firmicutes bacterium]|nr:hypothetical protein [Bacillota bacterium]